MVSEPSIAAVQQNYGRNAWSEALHPAIELLKGRY